jgi:NAD(P)-dependent dehydrogenase (short-subunit alcohol dehydrogenase family)
LLRNKLAQITGASRSFGFEISKEFAARGIAVILCSRSITGAEKAAGLIKGKVYPVRLDVINTHEVAEFVRSVAERQYCIDVLVNNAGYPFVRKTWNKTFHEAAEEDLDLVIEVDLKGTVRLLQAVIPLMIKNGHSSSGGRGGVRTNIASTPAISGYTRGTLYSIAKAGVIAITKDIALEYGEKNIVVYTLTLGNISAEATFSSMTLTGSQKAAMDNSMKWWRHPREVAAAAASLASEDFVFATGNTIDADSVMVML